MKHKAFQSAIYKQYNIICWYITNSFLLLERHHVTIMVSKTYRMSHRAEYQLFSWHTDGDEHFGGMSVLLDAIKCGILSMKHFLLRIRNETPDLRIPRLDALSLEYRDSLWRACSLFGSVANGFESYTVNSCCNTGHFFFFFSCVWVRFVINRRNCGYLFKGKESSRISLKRISSIQLFNKLNNLTRQVELVVRFWT